MLPRPPSSDLRRAAEPAVPPFSVSLFSLVDLLKMGTDQTQAGAESNEQQLRASLSSQLGGVASPLGFSQDTNTPWLHYDRRKRNFSHGLAGICCNEGCTKNDIGRLCWECEQNREAWMCWDGASWEWKSRTRVGGRSLKTSQEIKLLFSQPVQNLWVVLKYICRALLGSELGPNCLDTWRRTQIS